MKKHIILLLLCLAFGLLESCKSTQTVQTSSLKEMPVSYNTASDSTNVATVDWRTYFEDPNLVLLIDESLKNNLDLLRTLQHIEVARSEVRAARGLLLPAVSGGGSAAIRRYGLYTMDGAGNISTEITPGQIVPIDLPDYYLGFQTSWEVDIWGKLRNRKKSAIARYLSTIEGSRWITTNLVADIASSYYELIALDNELEIIRETIILQENAWSIVKIQKEAAAANALVVRQFEAQLLNSKSLAVEVEQRIIETESRINFLMGRYPQPVVRDKVKLTQTLPSQINAGIPSELLKNRPDIRQAEYQLTATKADLKAARAAFYPSLNISGSLGFQAFNTSYLFTNPQSLAYTLVGNLTAPLINRSAIKAHFNASKASQAAALYQYQESIINGYVEVYNELANIKNLQRLQELKKQEVNVLSLSVETSSELFRTARANYLEILMTQRGALQAKLELVNTQKRQYNAVINVYKALGGGWN